jgi:hypothetical protein
LTKYIRRVPVDTLLRVQWRLHAFVDLLLQYITTPRKLDNDPFNDGIIFDRS